MSHFHNPRPVTSRDLPMNLWGVDVILPAGTSVRRLVRAGGQVFWAVESERLLAKLSGNTHDPKYRWAFVPADAVKL